MKFIKIGKYYISVDDIIAVNLHLQQYEYREWKEGDATCHGQKAIHYVSVSTLTRDYDFEHGTPEAQAILEWLEPRSSKLV